MLKLFWRKPGFLVGILAAAGLLLSVACGAAEEPTPTPTSPPPATPTPTIAVPPTATPTFALGVTPVVATPTPVRTPTATPVPVVATPTPTTAPPPATPTATPDRRKRGGTLVRVDSTLTVLDPYQNPGAANLTNVSNVYSYLIRASPRDYGKIESDLAETWDISSKGAVWTFTMRQGVQTHDGEEFTVRDAAYAIQRILDAPNKLRISRQACVADAVRQVEVVDVRTLRLVLRGPIASFSACITGGWAVIPPKKYLERIDQPGQGRDLRPEEVVGTGPFRLVRWTRESLLEMERNPNYWRAGLPLLDKLHVAEMADPATRHAAFLTGSVHLTPVFSTPTVREMKEIQTRLGAQVVRGEIGAAGWTGFNPNTTRLPFSNRELRWAINLALNREEINALANEGAGLLSSPYYGLWDWIYGFDWYWTLPGFRMDKKAEDIARAQAIMRREGFGPDAWLRNISINCPTSGFLLRQCEVAREQLKVIWIDAAVLKVDAAARLVQAGNADFDIYANTHGAEIYDPDGFTPSLYLGGRNYGQWKNQRFVELAALQAVEFDQKRRGELLREMANIIHEDAAFIGTIRPRLLYAWYAWVKGFTLPPLHHNNWVVEEVWLDR